MKRSVCYSVSSLVGLIMAAGVAHSQLGHAQLGHQPPPSSDAQFGAARGGFGSAAAGELVGDDSDFGSESYEVDALGFGALSSPPPFTVLGPDGKPEEGAFVHAFDGRPIRLISDGMETIRCRRQGLNGTQPPAKGQPLDKVTDDAGHFFTTQRLLLIEGESGYRVTSLSEIQQHPAQSVQLTPWSTLQGSVGLNGTTLNNVRVYATWESFPHLPELTRQPVQTALQGPVIASYQTSAAVDGSGTFKLNKVPRGRIRLCVGGPLNERLEPTWMSNLVWWETVEKTQEEDLSRESIAVKNFRGFRLEGSLRMSDDLLAARTRVVSRAGRAEISTLPISLLFQQTESEVLPAAPFSSPSKSLPELMKQAVIWARPGGQRETQPNAGTAMVSDSGKFVCYLQKADYDVDLMLQLEVRASVDPGWAVVSKKIVRVSDPQDDSDVQLDEVTVPPISFRGPPETESAFEPVEYAIGMADDGFPPNPPTRDLRDDSRWVPADAVDEFSGFQDQPAPGEFSNFDPARPPHGLPGNVPMVSPERVVPDYDVGALPVATVPLQNVRQNRASNSPLESSIASLVTDILAAGDRRTRAQLKQPLKELLLKKFDAEQQAREALVDQLTRRLAAASKQVKQRAAGREQIVSEQLQRILGLPEDEFDLLAEPEMRDDFGDNLEQPLLRSQPRDFDPLVRPNSRLSEPAPLRPSLNEPSSDRQEPLNDLPSDLPGNMAAGRRQPVDRPADLPRPAEREPQLQPEPARGGSAVRDPGELPFAREPASVREPEAQPELVPDGSDFNRLPEPSDPAVPSAN